MSFLAPHYLWLLFALPAIAALYLLKVRPERRESTALFLWEKVFQERAANALFSKFRDHLSLLLVLLAAFCAILALARPAFSSGDDGRDLLLLIDNGASMRADGRLDAAKRRAREIVEGLRGRRKVIVASVSDRVEIVSALGEGAKDALRGIDSIKESFRSFDASGVETLLSAGGPAAKMRRVLLGDGSFKGADSFKAAELVKIGGPVENVGVCAFDATRGPGAGRTVDVFYQLASSCKSGRRVELTLCRGDGRPVKVLQLEVEPGVGKGGVFSVDVDEAALADGRWILRLAAPDATYSADKTAFAWLPPANPVSVGVVSGSNEIFYARCVDAFARSGDLLKLVSSSPEILVAQGRVPKDLAGLKGLILFRPEGESPYWSELGGKLPPLPALIASEGHPSLRKAPFEGMVLSGARKIAPAKNSIVALASDDGVPLLFKSPGGAGAPPAYVLNFDPLESGFFLSVAFPVSLCSMALDLARRDVEAPRFLRPGWRSPPLERPAELTLPDGTSHRLAKGDTFSLETPGFYELRDSSGRAVFACSPGDPYISLLDNSAVKPPEAKTPGGGFPLDGVLLAAALLLLALEEILYHRRKAG